MKTLLYIITIILFISLQPNNIKAGNSKQQMDLEQYKWKNRLILIFADNKDQNNLSKQLQMLEQNITGLEERDTIILQIFKKDKINYDLYKKHNVNNDFELILIGKDGGEKLRTTQPINSQVIFDKIDSMPMRALEMLDNQKNK